MVAITRCPFCRSENVKVVDYLGAKCIICKSCDYDERLNYDIVPEENTSQREKGRYNVYKAGGHQRLK